MDMIPLDQIEPNPEQPRKIFEANALEELAASIEENGLLQPITVTELAPGRYQIVAGERRWRAHKLLAERGAKPFILAILREFDAEETAVAAIIENDQRVDVTPLEQARSYQRMVDEFGHDTQSLAVKIGKPVFRIEERLRLLNLTEDCQFLLEKVYFDPVRAWAGQDAQGHQCRPVPDHGSLEGSGRGDRCGGGSGLDVRR
jgi:ParB family transcriptional regulator, chromosome partitioning protein